MQIHLPYIGNSMSVLFCMGIWKSAWMMRNWPWFEQGLSFLWIITGTLLSQQLTCAAHWRLRIMKDLWLPLWYKILIWAHFGQMDPSVMNERERKSYDRYPHASDSLVHFVAWARVEIHWSAAMHFLFFLWPIPVPHNCITIISQNVICVEIILGFCKYVVNRPEMDMLKTDAIADKILYQAQQAHCLWFWRDPTVKKKLRWHFFFFLPPYNAY